MSSTGKSSEFSHYDQNCGIDIQITFSPKAARFAIQKTR